MRIAVILKAVPDLVEEMELTSDGTDLDREYLKFVTNEWDEQALEEALLLKDSDGAEVVAVGMADDPDIEQALYSAVAKGADRAVTIAGATGVDTRSRAAAVAAWLKDNPADLVLSGVQAPDDLDGQLPAALGAALGLPHVSVVVSVALDGAAAIVRQEFSGGRAADLNVTLPAVLGIQVARQAPRYAPVTRVRQVMQSTTIDEASVAVDEAAAGIRVRRMYPPEKTTHAEMIDGSPAEVAARIVELLRSRSLVKG
ncbi:MAG: electron transfer flavoprotein subunit beta/FixA family protein [Actinobacteria bacterium]|nr:electron transfer flavoprotein subunit beta/FixA family protein [Actinomycetota bacterium]